MGAIFVSSNYAKYIEEREGKYIYEDEKGFATYVFNTKDECYIMDIFVQKEYRKEGMAAYYTDEIEKIAKERGCTYLVGSVSPKANNSTQSLQFMLSLGFTLDSCINNLIFFKRDIIGE